MHIRVATFFVVLLVFILTLPTVLARRGQTATGSLSGTVKDPNGAVVVNAQVAIRNDSSNETRNVKTDKSGSYKSEKLLVGDYTITVVRDGFRINTSKIKIESGREAKLDVTLELPETRAEVAVAAVGKIKPNSDTNYRALRDAAIVESLSVNNLVLKRDVGTLTLRSGTISFYAPVLERVTVAVFNGEGEFSMTPAMYIETNYLKTLTGKETLSEPFTRLVLCFTDQSYQEIKKQAQNTGTDARAADLLKDWHKRLRFRTERPRSLMEALLKTEDVENIEATMLADLYNSKQAGFFSAYIFGQKRDDLRFHVRPRGAFPQILSPEEVALLNVDWNGKEEGVLYLAHFANEYKDGSASSEENHYAIDAKHYKIETAIRGEKLTASAELSFKALKEGERVLSFGLLPELRVTRVTMADDNDPNGREIDFIQESRKEDGSFFAIWPTPLAQGTTYKITIEYQGDKVLVDEGGGTFAVGARTSWYPSVNSFNDRATFDLTFKVPKKYVLVGVGKLVSESLENDLSVTHWVSDIPLAVAGFNYGQFKKKDLTDEATKYKIEGYATSELPAYLRGAESIGGMVPTAMMDKLMTEAQNSVRIFNHWFGEAPYGRIAITQQPQPFFGQSWPTLVYLPITAFFDSTQRWQLMGGINQGFSDFIQEVTSHEVAHQWWGHIVGWASYHDQWLSEGFADFSASLYLQAVEKNKYLPFWEQSRKAILDKNEFGLRANDAGPLWLGLRLNSFKNQGAYNRLVYPKGGYVLHMLRWMMYDREKGDQAFIAMMHDFVKTNTQKNASTEGFKAIVEKHMLPKMDLEGNKRMDWFFRQWVYDTQVPRYKLEYTLTPQDGGKTLLTGKITQSEVTENFRMLVPIYLDFDGKQPTRLGEGTLVGNSTTPEFKVTLPQKPRRVLLNYNFDVLATESVSVGK